MSRTIRYKRPLVIAARIVLCLMAVTALLADFIANDQPIIGRHQQGHLISLISDSQDVDPGELAWAIYPPIRYHSSSLDFENTNYTPPLTRSRNGGMHWLGTDLIGRDVAAGMVYGCRYSLFTALLAVLITLLIGLPLGLLAGYVGNRGVGVDGQNLLIVMVLLSIFCYQVLYFSSITWTLHFIILLIYGAVVRAFSNLKKGVSPSWYIPFDLVIMRMLELLSSLPGLLILLALSAIVQPKGVIATAVIIGLIGWARIAQLTRNESLRIKDHDFIQAADALGLFQVRIIFRHILPNIWGPILVSVVFSLGAFILLESTLSFLGIGMALEHQTWGSLLAEARRNFQAWWLAIFPGMAIFLSIVSVNIIGTHRKAGK